MPTYTHRFKVGDVLKFHAALRKGSQHPGRKTCWYARYCENQDFGNGGIAAFTIIGLASVGPCTEAYIGNILWPDGSTELNLEFPLYPHMLGLEGYLMVGDIPVETKPINDNRFYHLQTDDT